MEKADFELQKSRLRNLLIDQLRNDGLTEIEIESIKRLEEILKMYTYSNRYNVKGVLSRVIVDDIQIDYSIGTKFLEFDRNIS